jgi:VWFA-related protein
MRKQRGSIRTAATIAAILAGGLFASAQQEVPGQRPAFRSGVELVTIDVNVVDRQGQPVRGLSPSDFAVTVEGQPRRVVSAEFVDVAASKTSLASRPDAVPISTNEGTGIGRQFVFIVDQSTLDTGSVRYVTRAASPFLSQLTFADRSALVLLPVGSNINFTWSHDRVREALQQVGGLSTTIAGWEYGSLAEARDIANHNMVVLRSVGQRACGNASALGGGGAGAGGGAGGAGGAPPTGGGAQPPGGGSGTPPGAGTGTLSGGAGTAGRIMDACLRNVQMQAESTWREAEMTSHSSLGSLRRALETLGRVPGDKTVIFLSGGLPLDRHEEIAMLGPAVAAAAAARVTLFPVFVPSNRFAASQRWMTPNPTIDQSLHAAPLQTLASMTGGEFFRAEVSAEAVFERLGREMSGYYRVGVEREPADRDGRARRLKVSVSQSGATVRARDVFDERTFEDRNWAARLASALDSPIPADGIALRVTSYVALHGEDRSRLNVVLTGDARRIQPGEATFQVVVRDLDGKRVLLGEQPMSDATEEGLHFSMAVPVPPGSYVIRVGVMDSAGQVGSVEHRVDAQRVPVGALSATGPVLVRVPVRAGEEPRVALGGARQDERLALELGLEGSTQQISDADVVFEIARTADGPALVNAPATLSRAGYGGAYLAQAVAEMRVLPPGEYVARAKVRSGNGATGELRRWFTVAGAPAAVTNAGEVSPATGAGRAPIPLSAAAIGAVQPFALEHVLAAPVLGGFLDRVAARPDAASPAVSELVERARAEGVEQLSVSDALAAQSPVAAFLRGLTLFSAHRFEAAAEAFRGAMRASPDFFPAMVYLGACYAAGGKDREAAGAWQTALIGAGDAVAVHRLLADALLRQGSGERALQAVERARVRWPDDAGLARQFVVAALLGGRQAEGLRALDALVERQEAVDEPTLALALLVLYESFESQRPIEGLEADRARMFRLAETYRAIGGPSLELIEAWVAAVKARG